ncbi:ribokinase [Bifidobacterium psychraerophilum]|uniref:ribokinase n=1 Tax=Bifidobacterium psychraerophilum TaxID=218140 RepID=UPI00310D73CF
MKTNEEIRSAFERVANSSESVTVIGSMNADYTVETERLPLPGETVKGGPLQILAGGKSANQASAAARIGTRVIMLGAVGDDANADFLLNELRKAGVDVSGVAHKPGPSGTTVITVDSHAENVIVYSAGSNAKVDADYVTAAASDITASRTLGLCLESPMPAVVQAATIAHQAGVTVLLNNSPFQKELPQELVDNADILLVNEHEMAQYLGIQPPANGDWSSIDWSDVALRMHASGFDEAIVTLGAEGSCILSYKDGLGEFVMIPSVTVQAVDTTGCGDAFMGAILGGLAADLSLLESARLAAYVAAYAATGLGAQTSYGSPQQILGQFRM